MNEYEHEFERWQEHCGSQFPEMNGMSEDECRDAFGRDLAFGTGGLRGKMGAGTNRMNCYTVRRASVGLAAYLLKKKEAPSVVIAYDTRNHSAEFGWTAADALLRRGVTVRLFSDPVPTPCLSFAVRYYGADAGVVVTASHNPKEYNGYKVYGPDGCQITEKAAAEILAEMEGIDLFAPEPDGEDKPSLIGKELMDAFLEAVKGQSLLFGEEADRDLPIVYTPLNGTGRTPVLRVLSECGFTGVSVVPEQEKPDGNFLTCPYPNPEIPEAMELGMKLAEEQAAELLIATDPDADRLGVAVRTENGMRLLTGNEVGLLLLDYVCAQRKAHGRMPDRPVAVKTIVTSSLADRIAEKYGVGLRNVLTGFKYIGDQIALLEAEGETERFLFGFEESCGYLAGSYVRDKDGVAAAMLVCEMAALYRKRGITLEKKLAELYREFGYCLNTLHSYAFPGAEGSDRMNEVMESLRGEIPSIGGLHVKERRDYLPGIDGLPSSNVLKFVLEDDSILVVRPSGTEPKMKLYLSVRGENEAAAAEVEWRIYRDCTRRIEGKSFTFRSLN